MPATLNVCTYCKKEFWRDSAHVQESLREGYKLYCSIKCISLAHVKRVALKCENLDCAKGLSRTPGQISPRNYCSHRCAAIVSNKEHPRNPGVTKICATCGDNFKSRVKYCSTVCQYKGFTVPKENILQDIKKFFQKHKRLPLKSEYSHSKAARNRFGTWNNAIKAAGLKPNPVMFANKHIALDGHKCDSLAERIIDDWLFRRKIPHERNVPYPGRLGLKTDFLVKGYWIEFFGLSGELKRYDQLKKKKLALIKRRGLKLIEIYPKHLFSKGKLDEVLSFLM